MADKVPRRVLPLTVFALSAGAAVFWAGSAAAPEIVEAWRLTDAQGAALSWSVQLGFITGTLLTVVLNIADRFPPRYLVAVLLTLAAAANASLVLVDALPIALVARFLTGAAAGPVYPIGMKLLATWFPRLGWQLGVLLTFNTLGFGAAFLLRAARLEWQESLLIASALAIAGGLVALAALRSGPLLPGRSRFDPVAAVRAFRVTDYRRSAFAYFAHMWELFALWALLPFWLIASGASPVLAATLMGGVFLVGAGACLVAGAVSRRAGEANVALVALAASGALCLASPWLFHAPLWILAPAVLVWGGAVIADSAMYSAISARAAPREYVGTALTAQNMIGFGITVVSIALVPAFAEWTGSWRWALALLAAGPVLGLLPVARLARDERRAARGAASAPPVAPPTP